MLYTVSDPVEGVYTVNSTRTYVLWKLTVVRGRGKLHTVRCSCFVDVCVCPELSFCVCMCVKCFHMLWHEWKILLMCRLCVNIWRGIALKENFCWNRWILRIFRWVSMKQICKLSGRAYPTWIICSNEEFYPCSYTKCTHILLPINVSIQKSLLPPPRFTVYTDKES